MPPRKSTRLSAGAAKQSKLSFNHRVTKNVVKSGKAVILRGKKQDSEEKAELTKIKGQKDVTEDSTVESQPELEPVEIEVPAPEKSAAELKAEQITDKAIERYWRDQEKLRIAKRVHQESLTTGEKVLRFFDVSSQYGPCVGITRLRRWKRAEKLGLNPPIEVLAVLLKENEKGNKGTEVAHMDFILSSTAVGSV